MKKGDRVRLFRTYEPEAKFVWGSLRDLIDEEGVIIDMFYNDAVVPTFTGARVKFDTIEIPLAAPVSLLKVVKRC